MVYESHLALRKTKNYFTLIAENIQESTFGKIPMHAPESYGALSDFVACSLLPKCRKKLIFLKNLHYWF